MVCSGASGKFFALLIERGSSGWHFFPFPFFFPWTWTWCVELWQPTYSHEVMDMKWRLNILRWVGQKEGTRRMVPWWHFWTFAPAPGRQLPDFLPLFLKYHSCVFCDLQLKVFLVDVGEFTLPLKSWTHSGFSLKRCSRRSSACDKNVSQPPAFCSLVVELLPSMTKSHCVSQGQQLTPDSPNMEQWHDGLGSAVSKQPGPLEGLLLDSDGDILGIASNGALPRKEVWTLWIQTFD